MPKRSFFLLCLIPMLLHAPVAYAWGLVTHVYFAQLLLWSIPLLDPVARRALRAHPRLMLAGACLPDLSVAGSCIGVDDFRHTHRWQTARNWLLNAGDDAERAIAIGYASHLLVDIIAHHHFVPEHEAGWADWPHLTHAACEWAMDSHVAPHVFIRPADALKVSHAALIQPVTRHFGCDPAVASRALHALRLGERLVRGSQLPGLSLALGRRLDPEMSLRFDHYMNETSARLIQINGLLEGRTPAWCPEGYDSVLLAGDLPHRMQLPPDLFHRAIPARADADGAHVYR